jgi:CheY-like chemotaxis protein
MKILITDDDPVSRRLMVEILNSAQAGYQLLTADDGQKGWEILEANPDIALAIIDLAMPGIQGMDWLDRARGDPRFSQLPIIVCTGSRDRTTVQNAIARRVNHFLVKPFNRTTVLEKVWQVCRPPSTKVAVLRDLAAARQQVDMDRDAQRELLTHYIRVADMWATDARRANEYATVRALGLRASKLKPVLTEFGATALGSRFEELEQMLSQFRTKPLEMNMPACIRTTRSLADIVQPEIDRLREVVSGMT